MASLITLHESNITSFPLDNGIGVLRDAVKAFAEEELNGIFEFEMEYDSEGHLVEELKEERIIKAKAQDKLGYQLFRIYNITKSHESDNLIIKGQHITYDLANNFVKELEANNMTKQQVMQLIGSSAVTPHTFNITSPNNTTRSTTKLYRTNPLQMIGGMQGSVLQIWGGQIERDNFNLILHDKRGHDDGVEVTYEKNITGLEAVFDISNVITRIFPFVLKEATEDEPEKLITITGEYINSPLINDYKIIRTQPIDFSQDERINLDGADAQIRTQLTNLANAYFDETGNDKAKVELDVNFAHLWETEEYKDVAPLELVGMGDTVTINHSKLKVYATATVNYIRYDCIAQVNEEVKLGSVKARLSDKVNKVEEAIQKVEQIESNVNQAIVNIGGKNKTYYGPDEPTNGMQKGDLWFKVVDGEYTQTYRYDGIEWQLIVDSDSQEAKAEAQEAKQSAQTAVDTANQSKAEAESAIIKANESFGKAQNALASSSMALQQSADAYDKSLDAFDKAEDGLTQANAALTKAQEGFDLAQENAEEIEGIGLRIGDVENDFTTISGNIQGLQTQVGNIAGDLSTVTQTANANKTDLQNARGDISTLTQTATALQNRLSDAEGNINTITNLATGTQQTVSNLQGSFTQLSTTVNGLQTEVEKKVDSTTYNTKVQQLDNAISQRVTKTDADTLYTQKSEFSVFAEGFSQRVDAIEGWEIGGRNLLLVENKRNWADASGRIGEQNNWRGWFAKVESNSMYSISRQNLSSRFRYYLLTEEPFVGMSLAGLSNSHDNDLVIEGIRTKSDTEYIFIYYSNTGEEDPLIKLEKGNKATDWSPAPEDTDQKFSAITQTIDNIDSRVQTNASNYSSISQTVQGIQNTVKDKANQSQVTQLSNLLNTTITNKADKSEVTQLATLVDTKVTSSQVNNLIANDKRIKDTREDNQKPSWYFSNHPRETVREFKRNNVLGITSDGSYGVLETEVPWSNTSGGQIKQTLYTDIATYERRGNNTNDTWQTWKKVADVDYVEGRITVLNNAINLRVKEGDVLSQINIEANRTLIQSNKLILDADTVTVTGTFRVKSANIESVDAGKMTTGTLNAAQVNIINMNANNITTGKLKATYIDVDKLSALTTKTGALEVTEDITLSQVNRGIYLTFENLDIPTGGSVQRLMTGDGRLAKHNLRFTGRFLQDGQGWRNADTLIGLDHVLLREYFRNSDGSNGNVAYRTDFTASELFMTDIGGGGAMPQRYSRLNLDSLEVKNYTQHAYYRGNMIRIDGPEYYIESGEKSYFRFINGTSKIIRSNAIYTNQSSASGGLPVYITPINNNLFVATSSEKFKINIERGAKESDYNILNVPIARWHDKKSMELYTELLAEEAAGKFVDWENDERAQMIENLNQSVGVIAEDLHDKGLTDYVIYSDNLKTRENVLTIDYSRLTVPLMAVSQKHEDEITILKRQNETLTDQFEQAIFKIAGLEERLYKAEQRLKILEAA